MSTSRDDDHNREHDAPDCQYGKNLDTIAEVMVDGARWDEDHPECEECRCDGQKCDQADDVLHLISLFVLLLSVLDVRMLLLESLVAEDGHQQPDVDHVADDDDVLGYLDCPDCQDVDDGDDHDDAHCYACVDEAIGHDAVVCGKQSADGEKHRRQNECKYHHNQQNPNQRTHLDVHVARPFFRGKEF